MEELRKWVRYWWIAIALAALVVSRFVRYSDSALAQSRGMAMLDDCLTWITLPLTFILIVWRNVDIYRRSARLWWRKCLRTSWCFGVCMAVIPTVMFSFNGKWDALPVTLGLAGGSLVVALVARVRLRMWHNG